MNQEVEKTLRNLLLQSVHKIHNVQPSYQLVPQPYLEFRRGDGVRSWHGTPVDRMCLPYFPPLSFILSEEVEHFSKIFLLHYPSYKNYIGIPGFSQMSGSMCLTHDLSISHLIVELFQRHGKLNFSTDEIDEIIGDFSAFVDVSKHLVRYKAILLNCSIQPDEIKLTEHLVLRKLSETEVSEMYGGFDTDGRRSYDPHTNHDCVLEGQFETKLVHSDIELDNLCGKDPITTIVEPNLNRAILALRTFKSGHIGYETIDFEAVNFCPIRFGTALRGPRVQIGIYDISERESVDLMHHSRMLFSQLDSVLETACAKLSEAEIRTSNKDQVLDAVVGLESILLASLGGNDRGELKFRFSLNYSTLFDEPETRAYQYRIAKDLYDIRSKIAHGGDLTGKHRLGDEKLEISEIAKEAREILRKTIRLFLPKVGKSPYKNQKYWENGYFGIILSTFWD